MMRRGRTPAITDGLEAARGNPAEASFINATVGIRSLNGAGLDGTNSFGFAVDQRGKVPSADNCVWLSQYRGSAFDLVPGMDPICGRPCRARGFSGGLERRGKP